MSSHYVTLRAWEEATRRERGCLYARAVLDGLARGRNELERAHGQLTELPDTRRQARQRAGVEDGLRLLDREAAELALVLWPGESGPDEAALRRLIQRGGLEDRLAALEVDRG